MSQAITIKNKVALVSGANRGIGKEIVIELLARGAKKVYLGVRTAGRAQDLLEQYGEKVQEIVLDLSKADAALNSVQDLEDVEILINNAGVLDSLEVAGEGAEESLRTNLEVNLYGVVRLTNALLPHLKKKSAAAIVTVGSMASLANMPMIGTYSVSKAAVMSAIQGYRAHLANDPILVAGVYPGPIETDMVKDLEMDKDSPQNVAVAIADGIEAGDETIFPDAMSAEVGPKYFQAPQEIEKAFAAYI
jgi:NAD(P)-dependent dehydrogenase (short-subunit alcohol dehydrogenase family)